MTPNTTTPSPVPAMTLTEQLDDINQGAQALGPDRFETTAQSAAKELEGRTPLTARDIEPVLVKLFEGQVTPAEAEAVLGKLALAEVQTAEVVTPQVWGHPNSAPAKPGGLSDMRWAELQFLVQKTPYGEITSWEMAHLLEYVGKEIRYNTLTHKIEWRPASSGSHGDWTALTDKESRVMWGLIYEGTDTSKTKRKDLSREDKKTILETWCFNRNLEVNPIHNWVKSLPIAAEEPDWNPISRLWHTEKPEGVTQEEWDDYLYWVGWLPFVAAVGHAMNPDRALPLRIVLVLTGLENIGKTSWLLQALPPAMREKWLGEVKIDNNKRDMVEHCAGRMFVEIAEAIGWDAKTRDTLKAFISQPKHDIIRKWEADPTTFLAKWVPYITTNERSVLPADKEYTRFCVVPLKAPDGWEDDPKWTELCERVLGEWHSGIWGKVVVAQMEEMREDVWAGARKLWEEYGQETLSLDPAQAKVQKIVAGLHAVASPTENTLDAYLSAGGVGVEDGGFGEVKAVTCLDLLRAIGELDLSDGKVSRQDQTNLKKRLEAHGFKRLIRPGTTSAGVIRVKALGAKATSDRDLVPASQQIVFWHPDRCKDYDDALKKAKAFSDEVVEGLQAEEKSDFVPPKGDPLGQNW